MTSTTSFHVNNITSNIDRSTISGLSDQSSDIHAPYFMAKLVLKVNKKYKDTA